MNHSHEPQTDPSPYAIADFGDRARARIIDAGVMTLLGIVMMAVAWPLVGVLGDTGFLLDSNATTFGDHFGAFFLTVVIVAIPASIPVICYEVVCTSRWGYTPGKGPTVQVICWEEYQYPTGIKKLIHPGFCAGCVFWFSVVLWSVFRAV